MHRRQFYKEGDPAKKLDRTLLSKGNDFEDLVDTYVIFITEKDKFGMGIPLYHIERKIAEMDNALFGDGAHILYVNGEYKIWSIL